jgi:hypothetical protein
VKQRIFKNPIEPERFTADAQTITGRVAEKLNRVNAAVLFLSLCFVGGICFMAATSNFQPPDYKVYIETTSPDAATADQAMADFYYAYWLAGEKCCCRSTCIIAWGCVADRYFIASRGGRAQQ